MTLLLNHVPNLTAATFDCIDLEIPESQLINAFLQGREKYPTSHSRLVEKIPEKIPETVFDLFEGSWVPNVHPHKKKLTEILRPTEPSKLNPQALQAVLDAIKVYYPCVAGWHVPARGILLAAPFLYSGDRNDIPDNVNVDISYAYNSVADICAVTDCITSLVYDKYSNPYSFEYMNSHIQRAWQFLLKDTDKKIASVRKFGGIIWSTLYINSEAELFGHIDVYDTGLGHLFLYDSSRRIYGWVEHAECIDWVAMNDACLTKVAEQRKIRKAAKAEAKKQCRYDALGNLLDADTYVKERGSGSSKVRIEARPDPKRVHEPKEIKFAEYEDGKAIIRGEHKVDEEAKVSLAMSNSRYANHTAVGYKFTTNNDDKRGPVIIKLGFLPDTRLSSNKKDLMKHRCDKAEVIAMAHIDYVGGKVIYNFDLQEACSDHDKHFTYTLGKMVQVPDFDGSDIACGRGIHFFFSQTAALHYGSQIPETKGEPIIRDSYDMMSNAVYVTKEGIPAQVSDKDLGYVYVPVTEAAVKIQREWKFNRDMREARANFQQGLAAQQLRSDIPAAAGGGIMQMGEKKEVKDSNREEVKDNNREEDSEIPHLPPGVNFDMVEREEFSLAFVPEQDPLLRTEGMHKRKQG